MFVWRFADAEFDEAGWELRVAGQPADMEPRPLEVLLQLLRHAGEVVTKEDLLDAVYGHRHLSDGALAQAIRRLRRALNDEQQSIIATVHRVGYKFVAVVKRTEIAGHHRRPLSLKVGEPVPYREHWKLLRPLGSGEVEVWLAEHEKTHGQRVLKFAGDGLRLSALKREVTLFRVLKETLGEREDLVRLIDWNFDESPYFIECEYGGMNLVEWAESLGSLSRIDLQQRVDLLANAAEAVAAIHSADVLHKDLKPANLLVYQDAGGDWRPRLTDFGSGRLLEPDRLAALRITRLGLTQEFDSGTSGTPLYLAPELIDGQLPTAQSDVYALGVMLYQLTVGDLRKPMTSGWEDDIEDELLRADIALATHGNPLRRLGSAQEFKVRLRDLPQRRQALIQEREKTAGLLAHAAENSRRGIWRRSVAALFVVGLSAGLWQLRQNGETRYKSGIADALRPSIAVLPFENLSGEPDSAYFAEGVQDEILTQLEKIGTLKVISRTSTRAYKAKPDDLRTVARQLGVANLLEGSVQRAAGGVRIAVQLIEAQGGSHLWAETYDRQSNDIFGVESEVAKAIADALQAKLTPGEKRRLAAKPTEIAAAYDAYLRGLANQVRGANDDDAISAAAGFFAQATELDPGFAQAWARLARIDTLMVFRLQDASPARRQAAKRALDRAVELEPDSTDTLLAQAQYRYQIQRDYAGAKRMYEQLRPQLPSSSDIPGALAYFARREGLWSESLAYSEQAIALDPRNPALFDDRAFTYGISRRYAEAIKTLDRRLEVIPGAPDTLAVQAGFRQAQGQLDEAKKILSRLTPETGNRYVAEAGYEQSLLEHDYSSAVELLTAILAKPEFASGGNGAANRTMLGYAQMLAGNSVTAKATLAQARADLEALRAREPDHDWYAQYLALTYAFLGEKKLALKEAERAMTLVSNAGDTVFAPKFEENLAAVEAQVGETGRAIDRLEHLLRIGYSGYYYYYPVTTALLRLDPIWNPLRADPRFQKLLADSR